MSKIQTLKSASSTRIDTGLAPELYSASRGLGESLMCPANAQLIQNDIYGRPASQNTLPMKLDASCAQGSFYPADRIMAIENQARPYIPIAAAGMRGAGDLMGVGRDLNPVNLYGDGRSGSFVRQYSTPNNAPFEQVSRRVPMVFNRREQPSTLSMDSQQSAFYRG